MEGEEERKGEEEERKDELIHFRAVACVPCRLAAVRPPPSQQHILQHAQRHRYRRSKLTEQPTHQQPSGALRAPSPPTDARKGAARGGEKRTHRSRTMESAGNGSDAEHRSQLPLFYNNTSFCRNFTDNASFSEPLPPCDMEHGLTGSLDVDANPVIIAIVITALYSIVCVVGLVGNVLVMYIIVRYTKMKTATNIYIFNLALADALVTSTLPFQSVNYLMGTWPFGDMLCKTVMSIDYYNMFTSIFTLTTMSIDRYVAVCHPVKALDFRTPRNAKIVNVCNWILSSAIGLPVMFMASTTVTPSSIVDCKLIFPHPSWYWDTLLKICVFIFAFIMPVLIITVCYGLMILRLKSVRMLSGSQEKDRNLRRITRMVLVVVAVFIVCWTPIHIFVIITALINIPSSTLQTITWHFCIALGYTNSSLNPVLYGYLDENFKRCFREFCTPSPSVLEMQNSSRTGATSRKLPQREHITANTGERSNQQV